MTGPRANWFGMCVLFACVACNPQGWGGRKAAKKIATADGRPVRKVYILAPTQDAADSAALALSQDTCVAAVSSPKQADAVLELSVALPGVGAGLPTPGIFTPSAKVQTLANAKTSPERSASASCGDSKGHGSCTSSYTADAGDVTSLPPEGLPGSGDAGLDVSLQSLSNGSPSTGPQSSGSPGGESQELWEPNAHTKKPWTEQLRVAAGCPVCPGERFNRREFKTYREWIQARCPAVLAGSL